MVDVLDLVFPLYPLPVTPGIVLVAEYSFLLLIWLFPRLNGFLVEIPIFAFLHVFLSVSC